MRGRLRHGPGTGLAALPRERHAACEREHRQEEDPGDDGPATPLPATGCLPATAKALVRVERWIQHGHRTPECRRSRRRRTCVLRSTIRVDGALRPRHPASDRGGPDRHRPLRARAHAAVEPRRARRPPVSRVPQLALPVHRRQGGAGGPHGARRGRGRRSRSSSTRGSSSSARPSSGSRCPTTSSRDSRGSRHWAGWGC